MSSGLFSSPDPKVLEIKKEKNKIYFSFGTVTSAPARNIADIDGYANSLDNKNSFLYIVPKDSLMPEDECEFRVSFY
ncbi:MAG: hypothetical protein PHI79_03365, partial [Sulfurovaceae bacterium]|nr:hypothetical protein [Sulfurovaceae bacterium]